MSNLTGWRIIFSLYWKACNNPGKEAVMYMCKGYRICLSLQLSMGFWKCSEVWYFFSFGFSYNSIRICERFEKRHLKSKVHWECGWNYILPLCTLCGGSREICITPSWLNACNFWGKSGVVITTSYHFNVWSTSGVCTAPNNQYVK